MSKIANKICSLHLSYFKSKWKVEKYFNSPLGGCLLAIALAILATIINVIFLSEEPTLKSTLYNIFNSFLIGVISSSIVTVSIERHNIKNTTKKRLVVLHELNFELSTFCSIYQNYKNSNPEHPDGHPIFSKDAHFCDKYVFLNSIVNICQKNLDEHKDYLNFKEYNLLFCIKKNYHCMQTSIDPAILSMLKFHPMQHQLQSTIYDDYLDDLTKEIIPELFNDLIEDILALKMELELEGFDDSFHRGILDKYKKNS